jgi:CheY-like chemotaxis protein
LSRKLADVLGGLIHVDSTPGKGSTFTLDIPVRLTVEDGEDRAEAAAATTDLDTRKILIVDDEEATRYVIRQAFASEPSWLVLEAPDGVQGLQMAQMHAPDFMVLDLNMPGLDGFEVFRSLKGDPATARIPVLVATSALLTADVLRRLEGAIAVLPKANMSRAVLRTFALRVLKPEG